MTVVVTVNTRRGHAQVVDFDAVALRQELNKPADRDEVQRSLPRHEHYSPSPGWAKRLMVSWPVDQWTLVPTEDWVDLVPATVQPTAIDSRGVVWKAHGGLVKISPARGIIGTHLEHTTGLRVVFLDTHFISSAWSGRKVPWKKWRQRKWLKHKSLLNRITQELTATGFLVAVGGDFNRGITLELPGLENPREKKPAGIEAYDQLLASPALDPRNQRRAGGKAGSDHYPQAIDIGPQEDPMPRGFMPGAIIKNIPPGTNDPPIIPVGGVCHVAVSESDSLFPFFNGPSGGVESHFYVRRDGAIEQYRSIYFEADANLDGNSFTRDGKLCGLISIETQGMGPGEWTNAQLDSIQKIMLWAHAEADVPLEIIKAWNGDGWGYHTMWGAPSRWTPVAKSCPGPDRVKQFHQVLAPWLDAGGQDPAPKPPKPNRVQQAHDLEVEIRAKLRDVDNDFDELLALLADVPEERTAVAKWRDAIATIDDQILALRQQLWAESKKAPEK